MAAPLTVTQDLAHAVCPQRRRRYFACCIATVLAMASLATLLRSFWDDRSPELDDPVVEFFATADQGTKQVARFSPRIRISPDLKYTHAFTLRNEGTQSLVIEQKSKSCDCLNLQIDREAILPGEIAKVTLEAAPGGSVHKQATATIKTDDGAIHVYQLQSWTYSPVMLDNGRDLPISLGQIPPGTRITGKHRLSVNSTSEAPPPRLKCLTVPGTEEITCQLSDLGVESFAEGRLQRRNYDLEVAVTVGTVPGLVSKKIAFGPVTGDNFTYQFSTHVNWSVGSPIHVDPPRWMVQKSELPPSNPLRSTFALIEQQKKAIRVQSVECSEPWLAVRPMSGTDESRTEYEVILDPTKLPGDQKPAIGAVTLRIALQDADPPMVVTESFKVIVPPRGG